MFQLAVCPMGLEAVVAKEIQELGYDTKSKMDASSLKETKQQSSNATCGYERLTVSKLSWAVLMRKHLTIYSNKLRRYLGKQLSTKKVISQCKDVALNQHYTVYLIAKPSLRRQ